MIKFFADFCVFKLSRTYDSVKVIICDHFSYFRLRLGFLFNFIFFYESVIDLASLEQWFFWFWSSAGVCGWSGPKRGSNLDLAEKAENSPLSRGQDLSSLRALMKLSDCETPTTFIPRPSLAWNNRRLLLYLVRYPAAVQFESLVDPPPSHPYPTEISPTLESTTHLFIYKFNQKSDI